MEQFDIPSKILNVVAVSEKLNFILEKFFIVKVFYSGRECNVGIILKLFPTLENERQRSFFVLKLVKSTFFGTNLTHW